MNLIAKFIGQFKPDGLIIDYDKEADVLYITDPQTNINPVAEMVEEGLLIRRDESKGICGITILNFMQRVKEHSGGIQTKLHAKFQTA